MNVIRLKKGFSPRIAGDPDRHLRQLDAPRHVGMVPDRIPFIKPRLLVENGDAVAIGTPLFEDKRNTRIRFLSPGGGRVTNIAFGPRRVIQQIVITLDDDERSASFAVPDESQLASMSRQVLTETLLAGGMWPFFRALPFMDLADPDTVPPAIFVRLGNDEPFQPDPFGTLHDSRTGLYRFLPPAPRVLGAEPRSREFVASSAIERTAGDPASMPANLRDAVDGGIEVMDVQP